MNRNIKKSNIIVCNDVCITSKMKDYTGYIFNDEWECIEPVGKNSNNRMLWKFKCLVCGNEIIAIPSNIKGIKCECFKNKKHQFSKSFYDWCIENKHNDWISLWDYELNNISPKEIGYGSDIKCYFKCDKGDKTHKSEVYKISNLTFGVIRNISCKQCNSFAQYGINQCGNDFLENYWDYDKNKGVEPWKISHGSAKKVWLKCQNKKHDSHEWIAKNAVRACFSCPECTNENKLSRLHLKVLQYLDLLKVNYLCEYNCNIIPINPKTNCKLPYDIEIPDKKVIIEINGEQHYEKKSFYNSVISYKSNKDIDEIFEYRKFIDEYKKDYAINKGYSFMSIPYWEEKNNQYINKINKILTNTV